MITFNLKFYIEVAIFNLPISIVKANLLYKTEKIKIENRKLISKTKDQPN